MSCVSAGLVAELDGVQEPTAQLVPVSAFSDADDAAFLSTSYGLTPDPWQALVLQGWLGRRADGKWAASRCGLAVPRQNGKNGILEMRELFGMVELGEKFLHTAHEVKTARKAFARLLGFFDNERQYPELAALVADIRRANGQEAIYLTNGGSVEFIARSKGSGRGFTVDVIVMDEAQELSDDALAALMPTVSAAPLGNPQLIFTGTPPAPAMNGEVFTRTRAGGLKGDDRRLCWHDWANERGADLDAPETWARSNPALGGRLSYEAVMDERAQMDDETFGRERAGIWDDDNASTLFDMAVWHGLADGQSQPASGAVFGIDVTPDHAWSALALSGRRSDRLMHVDVDDVDGHRRGTAWVVDRCADLARRYKGAAFMIDGGGPGKSLIPALEAAGLPLTVMATGDVTAACGLFVDAVAERTLRHRGQQLLDAAVAGAQPRPVGDGPIAFGRKKSDGDISPLNAACFAHWAAATSNYDVLQSVR